MPQWKYNQCFHKAKSHHSRLQYLIPVAAFPELFPMCSTALKIIATGTVISKPQQHGACHEL